ncbi:recombinase [Heliobacillus mobilis]|uniref:Holliday junction resolvase RecU n=1 Tax=Heliobacterium mobile TaxID=28064 RepID=A0A6I3SG44_HELMO|nr:Holliday junction resolvase RecU [Heliobacterium mobile]MTV47744.1 recombinase [Heliobacterium mobile]
MANISVVEARRLGLLPQEDERAGRRSCVRDGHANRGQGLEQLIITQNHLYRNQGITVIHKVPTEWIPIRKGGAIVAAKVTQKAAVDFMGVYMGRPIAFDAKDCQQKWMRWDRLEEHQDSFLQKWDELGGIAFILAEFGQEIYVIPWREWNEGIRRWRLGGAASFKPGEVGRPVKGTDYLRTVNQLWNLEIA